MVSVIAHMAWSWLFGWGGLSLLVAIAAGAIWWFIPAIFVKVRALAFNVMLGALAANFIYSKGTLDGSAVVQSQWDAARDRAVEQGTDARHEAQESVTPSSPPVGGVPDQRLRNDPHNRDR